jgi:hypothetical protein
MARTLDGALVERALAMVGLPNAYLAHNTTQQRASRGLSKARASPSTCSWTLAACPSLLTSPPPTSMSAAKSHPHRDLRGAVSVVLAAHMRREREREKMIQYIKQTPSKAEKKFRQAVRTGALGSLIGARSLRWAALGDARCKRRERGV